MLNLDLFINAYGKLYSNKGAMTPGVEGETVDGTSLAKLALLIEELRTRQFTWTPVRRTYITKKDGKQKRPLGIATWKDKVAQEVIRVILEAYYEPQFSSLSHGYRPEKGCHTALAEVFRWRGTKWYVEGDIRGCFNDIKHKILLQIIGRNIQDSSFLKLLEDMLKAGYLENWTYHKTYSGTPQGNIASPILSNIYLNELDKMIEEKLIPEYTQGKTRKANPEYARLRNAIKKADKEEASKLREMLRNTPTGDVYDPNFRRLHYVRYADDILLGFIGPRKEAVEIKQRLKEFLAQELDLTLSDQKTFITQASQEAARFLGYDIQCPIITNNKRSLSGKVVMRLPRNVITQWVKRYCRQGKPIHSPEKLYLSDFEIVSQYGSELRGLYNYYKHATNVSQLYWVKHVMMISLVKTLAHKHKTSTKAIYRKYKARRDTTSIEVQTQTGQIAKFGGFPLTWKRYFEPMNDQIKWTYYGRNELSRRLTTNICEIEGCNREGVEGHPIKALKNLKKRWKGKKDKPQWVKFMISRNRKVIMVCIDHHRQIHKGLYDGPKLVGQP